MVCERRDRVGEQWYNLRPDAALGISCGGTADALLDGVDRGKMNPSDLVVKFTFYTQYIASREWARERKMPPLLMCVAPDIARGAQVAKSGSGRTHISIRSDDVDDHRGALERGLLRQILLHMVIAPSASMYRVFPQNCKELPFCNPDGE